MPQSSKKSSTMSGLSRSADGDAESTRNVAVAIRPKLSAKVGARAETLPPYCVKHTLQT